MRYLKKMINNIGLWVSQQRWLPYRTRRSLIKRIYPEMLLNHDFEIDFFGMKYAGNIRNYIDRLVFFCGAYEKHILYFLRDVTENLRGDDQEIVFFDIGANSGNHTLFMSRYVAQVHAFEPYDKVRAVLEKRVLDNQVKNIKIHPYGLSNREALLPFYAPPTENLGAGSFINKHYQDNVYLTDLPLMVGDEVATAHGVKGIHLIKMDIEGYERYALEGLKNSLSRCRPIIVLELSLSTRATFSDVDDFKSVFPNNYVFFRFCKISVDYGWYRLAPLHYEKHYKHHDLVACPVEMLHYISGLK